MLSDDHSAGLRQKIRFSSAQLPLAGTAAASRSNCAAWAGVTLANRDVFQCNTAAVSYPYPDSSSMCTLEHGRPFCGVCTFQFRTVSISGTRTASQLGMKRLPQVARQRPNLGCIREAPCRRVLQKGLRSRAVLADSQHTSCMRKMATRRRSGWTSSLRTPVGFGRP